jgi:hypothetical protein
LFDALKEGAAMEENMTNDISEAVKTLSIYVDKGSVAQQPERKQESEIFNKPDLAMFKPFKKLHQSDAKFVAVDCSTRILKHANNWGVYLFRPAYAIAEKRRVDWGFQEKIRALIGPADMREYALRALRFEFESELALKLVEKLAVGDYVLLDGASYFGEKKGFRVSLFERCKHEELNLLTLSKQSPTLHDELGRDFQATAQSMITEPLWVYHPVAKANFNEHLYGDISLVKLCEESQRVFRLDVSAYLMNREVTDVVSPLTTVADDPRCLGYPVPLWLAHEFSATSTSKLLYWFETIENLLKENGLYDRLSKEELACSFADSLHGVEHAFKSELVNHV